jgi:hypothetical protein
MDKLLINCSNINWILLRQQKQTLLEACRKIDFNEDLYGIVLLLDHIQDSAAAIIGEDEVFGKEANIEC